MSTTSSRNFTTLYSGSGSVVPQGAYGNANVVSLLSVGTDGGAVLSLHALPYALRDDI